MNDIDTTFAEPDAEMLADIDRHRLLTQRALDLEARGLNATAERVRKRAKQFLDRVQEKVNAIGEKIGRPFAVVIQEDTRPHDEIALVSDRTRPHDEIASCDDVEDLNDLIDRLDAIMNTIDEARAVNDTVGSGAIHRALINAKRSMADAVAVARSQRSIETRKNLRAVRHA